MSKRTLEESGLASTEDVETQPETKKVKPDAIDFSQYKEGDIITLEDGRYEMKNFEGRLSKVPLDRPVRVYADGIYDLFHYGHMRSLQQAKNLFPNSYLIVGVCADDITTQIKGKTVMTETERYEGVSHCRYVDEVIPNSPWVVTPEFVEKHNIDFVTHGEDLSVDENGNDVYQGLKDMHRFLTIKRTEGVSTSDLIMRIIKDRDVYIERNLKRGYTASQLNVGLLGQAQYGVKSFFQGITNILSPRKAKASHMIFEEKTEEKIEVTEEATEGGIFDDEKSPVETDNTDEAKTPTEDAKQEIVEAESL